MSEGDAEVLREALDRLRKRDTFEEALGKVIRKRDMEFKEYIRLIGKVRDISRKKKLTLPEAARHLVGELEGEH